MSSSTSSSESERADSGRAAPRRERPGPTGDERSFARHLGVLAVGVLLLLAQVWLPNILVDPFWIFGGNRLGDLDVPFATRDAKHERLLGRQGDGADCLLAGSSRALLVDPGAFDGYRCVNLAVEAATLPESIALLERAAEVVPAPRLVIQTVDNFDLEEEPCTRGLARAEQQRATRRESWPVRYTSIDVLRFSRRVATGRFRGVGYAADGRPVIDSFQPYAPRWEVLRRALDAPAGQLATGTRFTDACTAELERLRAQFPAARLVGYVSPIAADLVLRMYVEGELDGYLGGVHRAAQRFDAFYDFAHPSAFTLRPSWSWDGSHHAPDVADQIASTLLGHDGAPALRVDELAIGDYRRRYRERIEAMIASIDELVGKESTLP